MSALAPAGLVEGGLGSRDLEVLDWVSEQYAIRLDLLGVLLGCRERAAQRWARRMQQLGLVQVRRVLADEPSWVWLCPRGQRLAHTDFRVWSPRPGLLAHVAAVGAVRLHLAGRVPEGVWVCERLLARDAARGAHLPDGVLHHEGQAHAVEVELTLKSRGRMVEILDGLSEAFDVVAYFATPAVQAALERLGGSERWPRLAVRPLPDLAGCR